MTKKRHQHRQHAKNNGEDKFFFTKNTIIVIGIIVTLVSAITYFGIKSMIPVNGNSPVFGAPKNNFVKASHHPQSGYLFVGQSAGGARKALSHQLVEEQTVIVVRVLTLLLDQHCIYQKED